MKTKITLDPAMLFENGRAATYVQPSASQPGYWNVGTGARWKFSGVDARVMEVDCFSTAGPTDNTIVGVVVNDGVTVKPPIYGTRGISGFETTHRFLLPPGTAKGVELLVPVQHAETSGGAPKGAYPMCARFDGFATPVPPSVAANHRVILADSIGVGGLAIVQALFGAAGLMKRGQTYQYGTKYLGNWSAVTTYHALDIVNSGKGVWRSKTTNTNVTPVVGANWERVGYNGSVTLFQSWGYKRIADDWSSSGAGDTAAAAILALAPSEILILLGTNDYGTIPPTSLANFQTYYERALDKLHGVMPTIPIVCISPLIRSSEVANSLGATLPNYRTKISDAVTARSGWGVPPVYVDGHAAVTTGELADGLHLTTTGHGWSHFAETLMAAL